MPPADPKPRRPEGDDPTDETLVVPLRVQPGDAALARDPRPGSPAGSPDGTAAHNGDSTEEIELPPGA